MLYLSALESWGWIKPSDFIELTTKEKALINALLGYVAKRRKDEMKK